MYLLGFTLNNFSFMALTISVGFVVDDAIVMIENIFRHQERGLSPMQAALVGVEADRLHGHQHQHLAGGGVHPDPVHGRHPGQAAA